MTRSVFAIKDELNWKIFLCVLLFLLGIVTTCSCVKLQFAENGDPFKGIRE